MTPPAGPGRSAGPPITDRAGLSREQHAALESVVGACTTLEQVLARGRELDPPLVVDEVVTQDEYTHDVLAALPDGRHLVFDTT